MYSYNFSEFIDYTFINNKKEGVLIAIQYNDC